MTAPVAAALSALNLKVNERFNAATLSYSFRHFRGRPVDIADAGQPAQVFKLEIADPRAGAAKVASWHVVGRGPTQSNAQVADYGTSLFDRFLKKD